MAIDFSNLQKVGRSFMLPIALLPAAGILLGIGGALSNPNTVSSFPALNVAFLQHVFSLMSVAGGVIFSNLALLFAIAVPVGMAKAEQGAAALAGVIAFLVMHIVTGFVFDIRNPGVYSALSDVANALRDTHHVITAQKLTHLVSLTNGNLTDIIHNFNKEGYGSLLGHLQFVKGLTQSDLPALQNLASLPAGSLDHPMGLNSLQMGVFGGIIAGTLAVMLHNRFYKIVLPSMLGFFAGPRFVPIITSFAAIILGAVMAFIWPLIQVHIIGNLGNLVSHTGIFGTFIYGVIERSLIPFGLHHIFYLPFWQTSIGGTMDACHNGVLVSGGQNIFFAQLGCTDKIDHFEVVKGARYMAGKFPFMIFGLPGAALAMYHTAKPSKKKVVAALVFSAAGTAMLTGITEPIEFSFLFAALPLYIVHCFLAGLSFALMHLLNVGVGQTFSGGLIDLTLFGILQGTAKTSWYWIPVVGVPYFFIYYFLFSYCIKHFDFKTPGREDDTVETKLYTREDVKNKNAGVAKGDDLHSTMLALIDAFGGEDNLEGIDACITRLRITVKDGTKTATDDVFKSLGAMGVVRPGNGKGVQAIYGAKAAQLKMEMIAYLNSKGHNF